MIREIAFFCDGFKLRGSLHLPGSGRPPLVIGCHGLLADRNSPKQIALAQACSASGIAYLRIDHRGCGQSQGDFETVTSLEARCRDLSAARHWAAKELEFDGRLGLFGSSMGGAVCLAAAAGLDTAAVVTVAAPIRSCGLSAKSARPSGRSQDPGFFSAPQRKFDISGRLTGIADILLFHGEADEVVPLSHAREIFSRVAEPKKLVVQRNGDHRMSNAADQSEFIELASSWFCRALF